MTEDPGSVDDLKDGQEVRVVLKADSKGSLFAREVHVQQTDARTPAPKPKN